uniref:Uncharacterized protein n=1 Tax=Heterorhabditis bacteriophora TaxID=37862 RepID=A0A1I7WJD6_HETBA
MPLLRILGRDDLSSRSIGPVDICELFVYRLLYYIKMGPEVYFIPNVHHSSFGLYIATREGELDSLDLLFEF